MSNPFKPSSKFEPLVFNADQEEYNALGGGEGFGTDQYLMRRSDLWKFSQCPSKFAAQEKRADTKSLDWGTMLDVLYLTPDKFLSVYVVTPATYEGPATRKKGAPIVTKPWKSTIKYCSEWELEKEEEGFKVVPFSTYKDALLAVFRLFKVANIQEFRSLCDTSVRCCVEYHDRATGMVIHIKMLLDLVPRKDSIYRNALGDLKTAKSAAGFMWKRHMFQFGYHYQAALYIDGWNCVTGEERTDFMHVVSENTSPFEPAQRFLSQEFLEIGRAQYQRDLAFYCQCIKANKWPGFTDEAGTRIVAAGGWHMVEPDPWMMQAAHDQAFVLTGPHENTVRSLLESNVPEPDDEDENAP